jgi:hypothetical protein
LHRLFADKKKGSPCTTHQSVKAVSDTVVGDSDTHRGRTKRNIFTTCPSFGRHADRPFCAGFKHACVAWARPLDSTTRHFVSAATVPHVTRPGIVERPAPVVHGRRGSSAFLPSLNGATTATNTHWPYMETLLIVYYIFKLG